jgi:hypothetical protein
MPLLAKRRTTGASIDLTRIEDPRQVLGTEEYVCPLCEQPLQVRGRSLADLYFAHVQPCTSHFLAHPETARHAQGKRLIRHWVQAGFGQYRQVEIAFEVPVLEVHQVVDVLVTFPSGWRVAHACQLAPITTRDLEERSEACLQAGIDTVWWLGDLARTRSAIRWCRASFGFAVTLDFLGYESVSGRQSPKRRTSALPVAKATSDNEVYDQVEHFLSFYLADREVQRALEIWDALSPFQLSAVLGRAADAPSPTIGMTAADLREAKVLAEESDIPMETVIHFLAKKALTAPAGVQSTFAELFEDTSMMTQQTLVNEGIVGRELQGDRPFWRLANRQALHGHMRTYPIRPFPPSAQRTAQAMATSRPEEVDTE